MEPVESASNNIYLHVSAGDAGKHPEVISCQSVMTCRTEQKIEKVKQLLIGRGFGKELLDESQHLVIIELSCNPGCEKELAQELTKIINEEANQEEQTIFGNVIQNVFKNGDCKVLESQSKVYLYGHQIEKKEYPDYSKVKAFCENFKPQGNINVSFFAQGKKEIVNEDQQSLSLSLFDFTLEYPNSKDIATRLQKYLNAIKEQFPLIAMLPQLKRINIRAKINSLDEISKNINFKVNDQSILHLFNQGKTLIQNEFRVFYLNNSGMLIDTTVKIEDMRFMLSKYLFGAFSYIERIF